MRGKWPRESRAAKEDDEISPPHFNHFLGPPGTIAAQSSASRLVEKGSDDFACLLARHHRDHLERSSAPAPVEDPFLQQAQIIALHELKATVEIGLDPAVNVFQPVGQSMAAISQLTVSGQSVLLFEAFNDHEQHDSTIRYSTIRVFLDYVVTPDTVMNYGKANASLARPSLRSTH